MPELPEVETIREGIQSLLIGQSIHRWWQSDKPLRHHSAGLGQILLGAKMVAVARRGKNLVIFLSHRHHQKLLLIHLGMSGRLHWQSQDAPRAVHDHWEMAFAEKSLGVLRYHDPRRFGGIWCVDSVKDLESTLCLGPEPIAEIVDPQLIALWREYAPPLFTADYLFERTRMSTQAIKVWLLNGHHVAGVGNIYASEALFLAKIHPARAAHSLTRQECRRLQKGVVTILRQALDAGGSTLRDYRQVSGEGGYFQFDFAVYDRAGAPCRDCQTLLKRAVPTIALMVQAGRSTYFCPRCQSA